MNIPLHSSLNEMEAQEQEFWQVDDYLQDSNWAQEKGSWIGPVTFFLWNYKVLRLLLEDVVVYTFVLKQYSLKCNDVDHLAFKNPLY